MSKLSEIEARINDIDHEGHSVGDCQLDQDFRYLLGLVKPAEELAIMVLSRSDDFPLQKMAHALLARLEVKPNGSEGGPYMRCSLCHHDPCACLNNEHR